MSTRKAPMPTHRTLSSTLRRPAAAAALGLLLAVSACGQDDGAGVRELENDACATSASGSEATETTDAASVSETTETTDAASGSETTDAASGSEASGSEASGSEATACPTDGSGTGSDSGSESGSEPSATSAPAESSEPAVTGTP